MFHMNESNAIVLSVNISDGGIPKLPIEVGEVTPNGLVGDAHDHEKHSTPNQAICIIDQEDLDDLASEGYDLSPGATGENLTVQGLNADELNIGDRLRFSGGLELEITKMRKPCFVLDAIDPKLKQTIKGRCGCYGKVIAPAQIRAGETIDILQSTIAND
ncbi:MAG: MOSC domain-containing protein [Planctomycetes bacterium]|nr:MOSC domain-containing protein [Planctomycetota bacterium]